MNRRVAKQKLLTKISAIACVFSIVVFSYFLFSSSQNQSQAQAATYTADQIVLAVNRQRELNGLPPLKPNSLLMNAAQAKAEHMAVNSYFSHVAPDGTKWSLFIKDAGYEYSEAGENLANGFDTVDEMVIAWMNSPSHRENIVNPGVSETGVGVEFGRLDGFPTIFVAQNFGRPLPQPVNQPTQQNTAPVQQAQQQRQQQVTQQGEELNTVGDLLELPELTIGN